MKTAKLQKANDCTAGLGSGLRDAVPPVRNCMRLVFWGVVEAGPGFGVVWCDVVDDDGGRN